jgi:hypothetical protein
LPIFAKVLAKLVGVSYYKSKSKWNARRYSKNQSKNISNGAYGDEETAAHASDTLARKLMDSGEKKLKLNFPDDHTEVFPEETKTSRYFGVSFNKNKWRAHKRSTHENKTVYYGEYKDEKTAAHASDTLARQLMAKGEKNHKLNFPDDGIEVHPAKKKTSSIYIGVSYNKLNKIWEVYRWSKNDQVRNGFYKDEETAARASDILARKLIANGEENHKLNFPDDDTEVKSKHQKKRKRQNLENYKGKQSYYI